MPIAWHPSRRWEWCVLEDEEKNRNIEGIKNRVFLRLMTGYKKFFDSEEIKIKMSFLLNVSNGSSKPEEFSLKDIEMLVDSGDQNWFKRAHIGRYLGIACIITSTAKLSEEDIRSQAFLQTEGGIRSMVPPLPSFSREDTQEHDIFISLTGALYVIVNSQKDKGKALKKHILKDIVPHGFDARTEEIQ